MYEERVPEHLRLTSAQIHRLAEIRAEFPPDGEEEIQVVNIDRIHPRLDLWPELLAVTATVWSKKQTGGGRSAHWLIDEAGEVVAHAIYEKGD